MTIERRDSFSLSREKGKGSLNALLGARTWTEISPGSSLLGGELTVTDENTVDIFRVVYPGSLDMFPIGEWITVTGDAINRNFNKHGIRWVNNSGEVIESKVIKDSGPFSDGDRHSPGSFLG